MSLTQPEYIAVERAITPEELIRYIDTGELPVGAVLVPGSRGTMRFITRPAAQQLLTEAERVALAHKRFSEDG